jgi:hypothetical protein
MSALPSALPYPERLDQATEAYYKNTKPANTVSVYGDQTLFQQWKTACVRETRLQEMDLFPLLKKLGEKRRAIAEKMDSEHKYKFGLLRTEYLPEEPSTITVLTAPRYREANQRLKIQFFDLLPFFKQNVTRCTFETEHSRYTIEKMNRARIQELLAKLRIGPKMDKEIDDFNALTSLLNCIGGIAAVVYAFKLPDLQRPSSPDLGPLSIGPLQFLVGTIEQKVAGTWELSTRHVAWINQAHQGPIQEKAIEYFKTFGFITIAHSPREKVLAHLKGVKTLTQKLVSHPYAEDSAFQKDLAEWEYRMFHAMPYYRGSASVIEILREAICKNQNKEVPKRTDLEALSWPFAKTYT